jgi:hypothetical protein
MVSNTPLVKNQAAAKIEAKHQLRQRRRRRLKRSTNCSKRLKRSTNWGKKFVN